MTPDERQLIAGLFDRMRSNGSVEKDRDADRFIADSVRQTPDAAYLMVQSVLAQEHYLQEAGGRIQELEAQLRDAEDEIYRLQQQSAPAQKSGGGSFLGGIFGGSKAEPQPAARGSVPSFSGGRGNPAPGQAGSPWGSQTVQRGQQGGAWGGQQPASGFGQQAGAQQPAQSGGPSFMRSAMTTAAGVAGGMLAANAIQGMLGGGHGSANAGHHPSSTQANSPYGVDNDADRQRALDEQQDVAQDQEFEAEEQQASNDGDGVDWGSDDTEI